MSTQSEVIWSHCNECGQETKHNVVHRADRRRTFDDDLHPVEIGSVWKFLQCCGCDEVALQRLDWCSEDDRQDGPAPYTYFPPRVSRRKPAWMDRLAVPDEYKGLLDEVYVALHADNRRLVAMGSRALIDAAIRRRVGDQGNFAAGLNQLVIDGLVSEKNKEVISIAVEAGSASGHRGYCPSANDVTVVIDIVENLIHNELLDQPAQAVKAKTPPRVRTSKAKKNKKT